MRPHFSLFASALCLVLFLSGCEDTAQGQISVGFEFKHTTATGGSTVLPYPPRLEGNDRSVEVRPIYNVSPENLQVETSVPHITGFIAYDVDEEGEREALNEIPEEDSVGIQTAPGDPTKFIITFIYQGAYVIQFDVEQTKGDTVVKEGTGQVTIQVGDPYNPGASNLPLGPSTDA